MAKNWPKIGHGLGTKVRPFLEMAYRARSNGPFGFLIGDHFWAKNGQKLAKKDILDLTDLSGLLFTFLSKSNELTMINKILEPFTYVP